MLWCCIDRRLAEFTVNSSRSDPLYNPTASVSSGWLGRARFRVLSPCSERLFVALSCLDTLCQEVSSRAIYVSDAVGTNQPVEKVDTELISIKNRAREV